VSDPEAYLGEFAAHGYREQDEPRFIAVWEQLEHAYMERLAAAGAGAADSNAIALPRTTESTSRRITARNRTRWR